MELIRTFSVSKEGRHISNDNRIVENAVRYYEEFSRGEKIGAERRKADTEGRQLSTPASARTDSTLVHQKNDQPPSSSSSSVSSAAFSGSGAGSDFAAWLVPADLPELLAWLAAAT
jgi:hypothetical protein